MKRTHLISVTLVLAALVGCGQTSITYQDASSQTDSSAGTDGNGQAVCGNSVVDPGEDCDLGSGNGLTGTCCTANCKFIPSGVTCRPAVAGGCDVAESCTGQAATCPADVVTPDGGTCSANGGSTCCSGLCSLTSQVGTCNSCSIRAHGPQRITIIESQSANTGHNMDTRWHDIATAAGHTATIVPQTTLDDIHNLDQTDILIVSSGVIDLPAPRRAVVDAFAASHRGVYLQGEYLTSYTTNIGFGEIVAAHGGTFTWSATVAGQQDPTTVNGCLANTPELSTQLTAYWYACTGTGSAPKLEVIHTAPGGQPIGWSFCLPGGGLVIFNTDQDFIKDQAAGTPAHMRNVLARLADAANCDGPVAPPPG